jgi:hypothetical protein
MNQDIRDFRGRNPLSLRSPAMKRRCSVVKEKQEESIRRVQQWLEAFPHDRVMNSDDTKWRVVAAGFWMWAETGREAVL